MRCPADFTRVQIGIHLNLLGYVHTTEVTDLQEPRGTKFLRIHLSLVDFFQRQ